VQLAKRAATVDRLSNGRLFLGIGVGWMREELEALDVDPATRGARTDESVAVLRALWADGGASFDGEFFSFEDVHSHPKPAQRSIPLHIGGHSAGAARRAGRLGDGFYPLGLDGPVLDQRLQQVREAAEAAGRDPATIELTLGGLLGAVDPARIESCAATGAVRMILATRDADLDAVRRSMDDFATAFLDC
jgi:probable F420-dependent oxidoreductase